MSKTGLQFNTPDQLKIFMEEHPCKVRYSLHGKLYIGLVNTKNDIIFIHQNEKQDFMDYVRVAHDYAEEYTATIQNIRRRGVKYLVA